MKDHTIIKELKKFIPIKKVLFATAQSGSISSDVDVYCVVKNIAKSQAIIFKERGKLIEIFIDSWDDMVGKIKNYDEITVGFILRMKPIINGNNFYNKAKLLIKKTFHLPPERLSRLQYRIKVIGSKYLSAKDPHSREFFRGQIMPYLIMALFSQYGVWPDSPKKWVFQLRSINAPDARLILKALINKKINLKKIIYKFTINFPGLRVYREHGGNKLTYLG